MKNALRIFFTLSIALEVVAEEPTRLNAVVKTVELGKDTRPLAALIFSTSPAGARTHIEQKALPMPSLDGELKVPFSEQESADGNLFTVLFRNPTGGVSGTPLEEVRSSRASLAKSEVKCSDNPRRSAHEKLSVLPKNSLLQLVDIRSKKRELLFSRVRSQMTPEVVRRLRQLEHRYGLTQVPALSPELSDAELTWRLSALMALKLNASLGAE